MNRKLFLLLFLTGFGATSPIRAEWNDSVCYKAEVVADFSPGHRTPFWLMNGQHGVTSLKGNHAYLRGSMIKEMDESRRFSWGAGADLVAGVGMQSPFFVQQLYGEVKYRCLDLMVGSKEMDGFLSNPELATGNLLFASNAHTIPQVKVGIFDFADVWFTKGWFAIKGYVSFGKFMDNRWIQDWVNPDYKYTLGTFYHSKALFVRGGNENKFPLTFEMGIEMATQFGGTTYYPGGKVVKMPANLKSFWKALVPQHGGEDTPLGEQVNVEGNFLGSWNFALAWSPKADWKAKIYYQHAFEDHSMLWIQYPWKDGLWGAEVKLPSNRWISEVVYEFLYSKDQAGAVYYDHDEKIPEQVSGRDNYYNHGIYNGWQNWGMGIGNPLFISPLYNSPHRFVFTGNRLWGHHLGFKGKPSNTIGYRILTTYQKNWGNYTTPFAEPYSAFNLLAELNLTPAKFKGWQADVAFAMDGGSLLGHNYGLRIKISKTGWLFGK